MSIYNFKVKKMDGEEKSLADYQGKVVLIVNTATGCGLTPQYEPLQKLYSTYHEQGLEILDFPCNQFGEQAPGTNEEIATFCTGRFGITFEQFSKIDVNGESADPLYVYLKSKKGGLFKKSIKWNFTKFLVDRHGKVIRRYAPTVDPMKIEGDINEALKG
ncbi:MAG: glutathione peroxidase [Anaerorhabdus sp.]